VAVAVTGDGVRRLLVLARQLLAAGVAGARQRLFQLHFEHRLQKFASPVPKAGLDRIESSKSRTVVPISDCGRKGVVLMLVMT
jgi:hypothetical protein